MNMSRYPSLLLVCLALCSNAAFAASDAVISQVYGGGGNAGATLKRDFIEIFNRGTSTVSLSGWSVQYASAAGTTWLKTDLTGSIAPGQYYLIGQGTGAGGTVDLPAPDASGNIAMSGTAGKVALVNSTSTLSGTCPAAVDFVGFGTTANCFEGTGPTPAPSNTTAAIRALNGCTDTDKNNADFSTGAPTPRNTASPTNACSSGGNNPPTINAPANPITTVERDSPSFTVSLSGNDDDGIYNWSATPGTGIASVSVSAGQDTPTATFSVLLSAGFTGTASFTASLSDNVNTPRTQTVNISVTAPSTPPLPAVVISQIYGGGGNAGAPYNRDYIELFNATTATVDLTGWTVQYGSNTGLFTQVQPIGGTIAPGEYYLIALASGAIGSELPVVPNVSGGFNMSATAGKVALANTGDALGTCVTTDTRIVDLVGFGSTASCSEGNSDAPGGNNSTAIFRKNGGFTDTNVNGSDFETGTPNPRRTAPIPEIGPRVVSTDPRADVTTAPRDLNVTVNFTEPVDLSGNWFNISCAITGLHNDATIAGGGSFFVITPNETFQPGEQCTVTVFKNAVRDQDFDDSGPDTDTLPADFTWSFSIAAGAAPPEPSSVHLLMGNPTDAMTTPSLPNNYLMEKPEYALSYNRSLGTPNWVSWHLSQEWTGSLMRVDTFRADPQVPPDWYRVQYFDYSLSGFDRGHLVPNADRDPETSIPINQATFLMTNMMPQAPDNNQGPWADLENYLRTLLTQSGDLPANELYIVSGPAGSGGIGSNGFAATVAGGNVTVPSTTWKVALILPRDSSYDLGRVTASTRSLAVIMPNTQGIRDADWETYLTTIDQVEALTGFDFFSNLSDPIEACIEGAHFRNNDAPCVNLNGTSTSPEGTAVSFTADASDPDGDGPLTYTWTVTRDAAPYATGSGDSSFSFTPDDNGTYIVTVAVGDGKGATGSTSSSIVVTNVAPEITGVSGPAGAIQLGAPAAISVSYTDAGTADTHTALFIWDDGTSSNVACAAGSCSGTHTYAETGIYGVTITVTDDDSGAVSTSFNYVIISNRDDAKVTGGGWFTSPAGAWTENSSFSGRASFNVNAQYVKGAPRGNTSLSTAAFNFESSSYDWIVTNGANGQYRGTGTINGAGGYSFLVTVLDADINGAGPDRYRIRIWNQASGATVYDNVPGASDDIDLANPQPIGGGNIKTH